MLFRSGRIKSEEKSIENLFSNVFPKSLEKQKEALYEKAGKIRVSQSLFDKFKENEIFNKALREVRTDPVSKQVLKGVPENSIQYINQIKIAMDTIRGSEKNPTKARAIKETTNKMLETLDTISPDYKAGRQLAERGIVRREIEDLLDRKSVV